MKLGWRKLVVGLFIGSLIWLILDTASIFRQADLLAGRPAKPVFLGLTKVRDFFSTLNEAVELKTKVGDLESKNSELKAQLIELSEKQKASDLLQHEFKLVDDLANQEDLIVGRVIGRSPLKFIDGITIDAGAENGVRPGQVVLANGFLVGLVETVSSSSSRVTLITDVNLKLPVTLQETRAQGIISGALEGLTLSDIAIDEEVAEGEPILTSSLANFVPADIPVGFVGEEVSSESEVLQKFRIASPISFDHLEYVLIWQQ